MKEKIYKFLNEDYILPFIGSFLGTKYKNNIRNEVENIYYDEYFPITIKDLTKLLGTQLINEDNIDDHEYVINVITNKIVNFEYIDLILNAKLISTTSEFENTCDVFKLVDDDIYIMYEYYDNSYGVNHQTHGVSIVEPYEKIVIDYRKIKI